MREFSKFWVFLPILAQKWPNLGLRAHFWPFLGKMGRKTQIFENSRITFFSTSKDSNLTKYWVYSINRAQINWWKAFLWFKLPDPWFLVRMNKNWSFFDNFWKNMCIPSKKVIVFPYIPHNYNIWGLPEQFKTL